jgi:23S rRNA (uracil1939-C5)-methyltransferase
LITDLEGLLDQYQFDAYIQKDKSGYLKSVVIRRTQFAGEIQLSFLLMNRKFQSRAFIDDLTHKYPNIKSIYFFYTDDYKAQVFFTNDYEKVYGKATINERLNQQTFSLYPESFWQLNTLIADSFYQKMINYAGLKPTDIVIDAYAGLAMISHYAYKLCHQIYAIEIDQKSVQSAILSLKRNHINNVKVINSDFGKALKNLNLEKIDVMFFDPPRGGLGYQTIKRILKFKPRRLIYGSCNPSTLSKDLKFLLEEYDLVEVQPFDMFPNTPLVESVTLLTLKKTAPTKELKNGK